MKVTDLWAFRDQAVAQVDLTGFELHALDGAVGKVTESIEGSGGGYLVVDSGAAMPLGRQLLVPAGLIEKVEVDERRVTVKAQRDQIRNAPEYESGRSLDERSRSAIGDYYRSATAADRGAERGRATKRSARASTGTRRSRGRSSSGTGRARSSGRAQPRTSTGPTRAELYEEAKQLGIEGRSKMSKAGLARAVGRRRGRSTGARGAAKANPVSVQAFLEGVGYPTGKRQLLREAESQGAAREVRATLKRLPEKSFDSPTEVSEAIGKLR